MANIGTTTAFYKVEASLNKANEEVSKSMERLATGRQNANAEIALHMLQWQTPSVLIVLEQRRGLKAQAL